ncbi:hypothetical protein GCWU000341_00229 [Oribacterium sp. oral taxon 078 str. F0262]|nr:hypothetical protein GCWU000341_00229 [Oribacterium sp. oral taxon 078 str. F0262]
MAPLNFWRRKSLFHDFLDTDLSILSQGERGIINCGDSGAGRLAVHQSLKLIGDRSTVQYALKKTGKIFRLKIKAPFPH